MNNQPSIDDWFKNQFEGFAPDAPDVWGSIQQGIQAGQAATGAASVTKSALSVGAKWVIATALVATITTAVYFGYQTQNTPSEQPTNAIAEALKADSLVEEDVQPLTSVGIQAPKTKESDSPRPSLSSAEQANPEPNDEVVPLEQNINAEQSNPTAEPITAKPTLNELPTTAKPQALNEPNTAVVESEQKSEAKQPNNSKAVVLSALPNVITPNGDGLNDSWIIDWEDVQYTFIIIDQKGNLVYESKANEPSWNGVNGFTGQLCEKGDYIFVIRYQPNGADNQEQKTGPLRINY
ncbi:MAG: gliding motility-associated C-terminal domain-containing protein [Bacteroidia bacterium]|jgi:gliding motility-associated-like protein|nr:gliding motility-associated C-terminal domain-containing protein [Bacteroidia bacterium]